MAIGHEFSERKWKMLKKKVNPKVQVITETINLLIYFKHDAR